MRADFPPSRRSTTTNSSASGTCSASCMRRIRRSIRVRPMARAPHATRTGRCATTYVIEVTPRPEKTSQILQSKTIVYIDGELWFNPYVDSYDRRGELWKTQIYLSTYRDRPVPGCESCDLSVRARVHPRALRVSMCRPGRSRPAIFRAPTLPSVNAGTSTWARSIASSSLPMRWSKPVTNAGVVDLPEPLARAPC